MTLTKASIIEHLVAEGLAGAKARKVVETLLETIKSTLEKGDDILVSGFGKFYVKGKAKRRGRNPATGEDLMLRGRRVVVFKTSPVLRDRINGR